MEGQGQAKEALMHWTSREIAYLEAHAHEGAQAIAEALGKTVSSVQLQAHRYGISLRKRWICPKCGEEVYTPLAKWTGWCRQCTTEESRDKALRKNEEVRRELKWQEARYETAKRDRQRLYEDTRRTREELKKLQKTKNK